MDAGQSGDVCRARCRLRHSALTRESPARGVHYRRAKDELRVAELEHPDPKTRAALHYARTLTLDDGRDREVYAELKKFYSNSEIIELSAFFCLTAAVIAWPRAGASNPTATCRRSGEGNVDPWKRGTAIAA